MRLILGLVIVCALGAGLSLNLYSDSDSEYEEPTVLITLLVRNKAHILPLFLSFVERLDYPKHRIAFWLRCDHSSDNSIELLQQWLSKSGDLYHSVNYSMDNETKRYQNESSIYDWPESRFKHVITLKEEALRYARDIWADYIFFLDADVLLTARETLKSLTRLQLPIVAPMLLSESLYSNFWCGMSDDYYYQRTDEYKEIYHGRKLGVFKVPMVHTAVLVNLNYAATRNVTFDRQRLMKLQQESVQPRRLYDGPVDDIIVFAISANSSGLPLRISNELHFGYLMQPLETSDTLEHDLQQLLNIRVNMVHDLGVVPPVLGYFQHRVQLPKKSKLNLDHIFMINLQRRPERREKMLRLFDELGLQVEHFAAVDGKALNVELVQQMGINFLPGYEDPYHHRPMTMGEIGCFLSHYRIWQQIVQNKLQQVLILEDDIRFEPYFKSNALRVLHQDQKLDYDLIYFGRKRLKDEDEPWVAGTDNLVHAGYSYWTLAYVITLQGAQKLLAANPLEKLIPVDEFLPIMFNRHPQKNWSAAFEPRNLIAFSAAPLLLYPTHYTGESGYISDTEDSQQVEVGDSTAGEAQPKSDRQQIFPEKDVNVVAAEQELTLSESIHSNTLPQMSLGASQLHIKSFELLDQITNEHNGDVYETLNLILNQSFYMHGYPENSRGSGPQRGEHISDWLIKLLGKYPAIVSRVLKSFIETILTNPIREWRSADEKVAIGYAAKYDAALYAKCNINCTDLLVETIRADDAICMQLRSLELGERILQQQTEVEWSIFRHDVSTKPREVAIIRETIRCLNDRAFSVRRKASQVLNSAMKQSSPISTRILNESISFVRYKDTEEPLEPSPREVQLSIEKPGVVQYAFSFEGHEELEIEIKKLPQTIYNRFLNTNNGVARCSGITLLERLALINPRIIYDTNFERETSYLAVDMLSSVRKASLESFDTLLQTYSNCSILIEVYCRIWPNMLNDEDVALQKLAMHSFNKNVLMNIKPREYSNEHKNLMAWRILTTVLTVQPRDYLHSRLSQLLQSENMVTPKLVNTIISHLSTSMATEAWTLLLFLSSRITINLDALISTFHKLSLYNMKSYQVIALQTLSYCLSNFSKAALNQIFERLREALCSGSIWTALVSPAILLLNNIDKFSHSQAPKDSSNVENWQLQMLKEVTIVIRQCLPDFPQHHMRLCSLLATYSEIITIQPQNPDMAIVKHILRYLQLCSKLGDSSFDTDNERLMNWLVVIAGRLSLRDNNLANRLAKIYGQILSQNDRPQLINSTLIGLNDLGKKYPSILENNMNCILVKLSCKYPTTRVRTYRCVKDVILTGNIKLKGAILISLLAGLVDDSIAVAREADAFFIRYKKLYDKMLFHHCIKECPFDFNDQTFLRGSASSVSNFNSPLKGAGLLKKRRLIYNHILNTLDENTLLLYFGQLKLLAEKTRDKVFIKSPGALDVIIDILFIMRRICYITKAKRQQGGAQGDGENDEEATVEESPPVEEPANPTPKGRGRGARNRDISEEPLKQLERCLRYVAETHKNLGSVMNRQLQDEFTKFCRAMSMRFPNYTDFAQPAEFWKKYKYTKTNGKSKDKPKTKRRRLNEQGDDADADEDKSEEEDSDSDNELPLDRQKQIGITEVQVSGSYDVLATELIFQLHDW